MFGNAAESRSPWPAWPGMPEIPHPFKPKEEKFTEEKWTTTRIPQDAERAGVAGLKDDSVTFAFSGPEGKNLGTRTFSIPRGYKYSSHLIRVGVRTINGKPYVVKSLEITFLVPVPKNPLGLPSWPDSRPMLG